MNLASELKAGRLLFLGALFSALLAAPGCVTRQVVQTAQAARAVHQLSEANSNQVEQAAEKQLMEIRSEAESEVRKEINGTPTRRRVRKQGRRKNWGKNIKSPGSLESLDGFDAPSYNLEYDWRTNQMEFED